MSTLMRLLVVVAVAVVLAVPATWAQMRPECPEGQGACFTELEGDGFGFTLVDADGDAWQAQMATGSPQDFFLTTPSTPPGHVTLHLVSNEATIFACRAGTFPACGAPPFPGLLQGKVGPFPVDVNGPATWLVTGDLELDGFFVGCPFVNQSSAIVADVNTGEKFKVETTYICAPGTGLSNFDIKIRPIGP